MRGSCVEESGAEEKEYEKILEMKREAEETRKKEEEEEEEERRALTAEWGRYYSC